MHDIIHPNLFWSAVSRVTQTTSAGSQSAKSLCEFLSRHFDGLIDHEAITRSDVDPAAWKALRKKAAKRAARHPAESPDPRLVTLARRIGLSRDEAALLSTSLQLSQCEASRNLGEHLVNDAQWPRNRAIWALTGIAPADVATALSPRGRLALTDLIDTGSEYRRRDFGLDLTETMDFALSTEGEISDALVLSAPPADVTWADYDHLAPARDFARNLLKGALETRATGVNILLYGPPGTGKTQLCRLLAQELAADLRVIRDPDDHQQHGSCRSRRMKHYDLAQLLFARSPDTLLLFDEIEDLLPAFNPFVPLRSGKAHLNTLFEDNPVPVLWTTNDISGIPEHIRRRISYSLEMRLPPESARRVIWRRLAMADHSDFPAEAIGRLAQDHPVAPAVLKNALRVAALSGGGIDNAEFALGAARGLIEGVLPPAPASALFEPALTRTDFDLEALILRLKTGGGRPVSLCLSGPPGTGKSAFARHLAAEMGLEVIQKRASDLLSCWVGQSEQNIAAAFAEARARRAFLIFDEADSLLADREDARQSWEVSQVNEMLTWMESHPLPFACTTNLIDRLDPASMRRFTFKIGFEPLDDAQQKHAFLRFFRSEAPPSIADLSGLTPGDFACVLSRLDWLSDKSGEGLVRELGRELSSRQPRTNPIGFRPH